MNATIQKLIPKLQEVFHHLHTNPEISWQEFKTTDYIKSIFEKENCTISTFDDIPGLIVEIGRGKPVVALRADIDALWQEVDGKFQANHSCGHDAHMTIVIGTILNLLHSNIPKQGTLRFIFQPAEEKGTGALAFVKKGIVDDVDYLYGMHLRPIEELANGKFAPAIRHGAACFMKGEIVGEDAHGARPHLTANAIQVGCEFFQHINQLQINPMVPYSAKFTSFHAGGKSINIIPGSATFSLDIRAQTNDVMYELIDKIHKINEMLTKYHKVKINLETVSNVAAAVINENAVKKMKKAIINCMGEENLAPIIETTGGDDFHFYTIKRPDLKATMLAIGCDLAPGLHHPNMTFNHDAIPKSIEILSNVLIDTLQTT